MIFSNESMKERYLIYRDVIMICPCMLNNSAGVSLDNEGHNRFRDHMGVGIYGVNSNGRNIIFGIALGK